jgi:hypothetical protein
MKLTIAQIKKEIKNLKSKLLNNLHKAEHVAIRELHETHEASLILLKMSKGKKASKEEIEFLKGQSIDIAKALAIIGLQAIPFSSAGIIAIEAIGRKHGFSLFPKKQKKDELKNSDNQQDIK